MRSVLEGEILATDPKPFKMVKSVFQSCMNKELIEKRGMEPLRSVLKKLGGWPVLEGSSWKGDGFKWYEQMYRHREMGYSVDYFYDFSVTTDLKVHITLQITQELLCKLLEELQLEDNGS